MNNAITYYKHTNNIGDDIQTYAAAQILNHDYKIALDRESLDNYIGPKLNLLCNGYFMTNPKNWPPSENLIPFFISMHISNFKNCQKLMFDSALKPYYKRHLPIGCRDKHTLNNFKRLGIESYFSACLTLTLNPPKTIEKSGEIIFTEPFLKIDKPEYQRYFEKKLIPSSIKSNVINLKHIQDLKNLTFQERMNKTGELLQRYANAQLVVTSRIHCALPCLAFGTPVYFVDVGYNKSRSRSRFDGILQMMNVLDNKYFNFSSDTKYARLIRKLELYKFFNNSNLTNIIDWDHASNKSGPIEYHRKEIIKRIRSKFLSK